MRVLGLTGGIGCGKSTVARLLAERGARVIDADQVARDVVRPGEPAHAELVRAFGEEILAPDGGIDRTALGTLVFSDEKARARLNAITHPRIALETARRLTQLRDEGAALVIYEAALLVETGAHRLHEGLIVVTARPEVQLARLMERDRIDEAAARQKIASQWPIEKKIAVADYVIDNSGSLGETRAAVDALWERLQRHEQRRPS